MTLCLTELRLNIQLNRTINYPGDELILNKFSNNNVEHNCLQFFEIVGWASGRASGL